MKSNSCNNSHEILKGCLQKKVRLSDFSFTAHHFKFLSTFSSLPRKRESTKDGLVQIWIPLETWSNNTVHESENGTAFIGEVEKELITSMMSGIDTNWEDR